MIARKAVAIALVLVGCQSPEGQTPDDRAQPQVIPRISLPPTRTAEVVLDFDEPGTRGPLLFRIPFGEGKANVGRIAPCMDVRCPLPCPCTTQIIPLSFAPTRGGGVWILDPANERLARFSSNGAFVRKLAIPGNDLRNYDVVLFDGRPVVIGQRLDFSARLVRFHADGVSSQPLRYEGERAEAYSLVSSQNRLLTTLFVEDVYLDVEEVAVEIDGRGVASKVPGLPFLDGWKIHHDYMGPTTIRLEVTSTSFEWLTDIEATLTREINGVHKKVSGSLMWEIAITDEGEIHLLVHAQTERGGSIDAFWFISVSPEGVVDDPVKLQGPLRSGDQQNRHLALRADREPVLMWVGKKGLIFETVHP